MNSVEFSPSLLYVICGDNKGEFALSCWINGHRDISTAKLELYIKRILPQGNEVSHECLLLYPPETVSIRDLCNVFSTKIAYQPQDQ